jgi:hypothetical protein
LDLKLLISHFLTSKRFRGVHSIQFNIEETEEDLDMAVRTIREAEEDALATVSPPDNIIR